MKFGEDAIYVDVVEEREYSDELFFSTSRLTEDPEFNNPHMAVWFFKTKLELNAYLDVGWLVIPAKLPTTIPNDLKHLNGYLIVLRYSFTNMQMTDFLSVAKWILEEKNIPDTVKEEVKIKLREHVAGSMRSTFRFVIFIPEAILRKKKILPIATMIVRTKETEGKYVERDEYEELLTILGINKEIIETMKKSDKLSDIDVVAKIKFNSRILNKSTIKDVLKTLFKIREESMKTSIKTSEVIKNLEKEVMEKIDKMAEDDDIKLDIENIDKILEDLELIKNHEKKLSEVLSVFKSEIGNLADIEIIDLNGVDVASIKEIIGILSSLDFSIFMNRLELQREVNNEILELIKQLITLESSYIKRDTNEFNKVTTIIGKLVELTSAALPEVA